MQAWQRGARGKPGGVTRAGAAQVAAGKVMGEACGVVGNRDIEPFIPVLVSSIARPAEVPDCVHKLSATTFVQARAALCGGQRAAAQEC